MNTRQLRHFLALLDQGSLSAAADAVHLSQPALSRSIRALEEALGVPLFDRHDRRLRPTSYARAYESRARQIIYEEKEGARALTLMHAGELGPISLGVGPSLAELLLGPILLQLLRDSPDVKVRTMVATSDHLMEALLREQIDFLVADVGSAERYPDITVERLYPCTFGWYGRKGHPLSGKTGVTISDLKRYPLVVTGNISESLSRQFSALYGLSMPMVDHFSVTTDDIGTVQRLIASSDAIFPCTDIAMMFTMLSDSVVPLDVTPPLEMDMTLGIVYPSRRTLVPVVLRAFEIVRDEFARARREIEQRKAAYAIAASSSSACDGTP